jgi:hypothetical protein
VIIPKLGKQKRRLVNKNKDAACCEFKNRLKREILQTLIAICITCNSQDCKRRVGLELIQVTYFDKWARHLRQNISDLTAPDISHPP